MSEAPAPFAVHQALAGNTGFLISRMGMIAQRRFADRMAAVGLTPRMWGALHVLDSEGAITQHALCKSVGMDPSSMVATIDDLEAAGLVDRRRHPQDRRAYALHVTSKGQRTLAKGREVARAAQDDLLAPLTPKQREQLHELLLQLAVASSDSGQAGIAASSSARAGAGSAPERAA